ncbi:MAG: glycosyltransferase family 4 protein [Bacteroidales bacterium]|nr:glycosyltransferase family 4 protein [Bacteroidales bacterium]
MKDQRHQGNVYGLFNDSFPPIMDGVTLAVQNYAHWLQQKGRTPVVVTPWNPESNEYPYEVKRYFSLPIWNRSPYRYGYPKLDPFIWHRLRKTPFSLVHAHCPFSSGRLAVYVKKHRNIPLIATFHSKYRQDLEHSFQKTPWMVGIIMKRILNFFNACDEVWIPQAQVEETVREYGYKGKLTVVENGNDFASLAGDDVKTLKAEARRNLGYKDDELVLLFVGQHIWEKGLDVILETLERIKDKVKFRMNFIGTGYAYGEIRDRLRTSGLDNRAMMHGLIREREKLADYYAASDLFLFPSLYDNAPLVVREAAAMGTPSILVEGSTAAEVVRDGENGFLVNREAESFGNLIHMLSEDRETLDRVARGARTSLVRSWEDVVEEVDQRYKEILERHEYGRK